MFIPRKSKTFDKLVKQSELVKETAKIFKDITHDWNKLIDGCAELEALENQADEQVHSISGDIDTFFILPLDKEDISELTESLDDVVDNLEQIANRIKIYRISQSNDALKKFSNLILQAAEQIHQGILLIREHKMASVDYATCYKKLQDLENEGDHLHRKVLGELFGEGPSDFNGKDPLSAIKWKEIFQTLEDTLDRCEDIAVMFSRLRTKYG